MPKFPDPIPLPSSVSYARQKRKKEITSAIKLGVFIRTLIALAELSGYVFLGSSALLMDGIATALDIATTGVLFLCIKFAERPPDKNHPFGHGRVEPLAGMQLALLLSVIGIAILAYQGFELQEPLEHFLHPYAWVVSFGAVVLLEICYQFVNRKAKQNHSPALASDAIHYRLDAVNSLLATIALVIASYVPKWALLIDHLGAMAIALLMVVLGIIAAKDNFNQLIDKAPDKKFFKKVREAAMRVKGVKECEKLRIQLFGPDAQVNIDVEVDPKMSVDAAHKISQKVRAEIQEEWPAVRDVIVHIEPYYPNDH